MRFQSWLEQYGERKLGAELGVSKYVVWRWRKGLGWPHMKTILRIMEISGGELTLADLVEGCAPEDTRPDVVRVLKKSGERRGYRQ